MLAEEQQSAYIVAVDFVHLVWRRRSMRRDTAGSRGRAGRREALTATVDMFRAFKCASMATWQCIDEHLKSTDGKKKKYLQEKDWGVVEGIGGAETDKGCASWGLTITKAAMPGTTCPLWTGCPDSCIYAPSLC